jgi:hypothetical protein
MTAFTLAQIGSIAENVGETFGILQATVLSLLQLVFGKVFAKAPVNDTLDVSEVDTVPNPVPAPAASSAPVAASPTDPNARV